MYRVASGARWGSAVAIVLSAVLLWAGAALAQLPVHHYEYVFTEGNIYVYDIDNGFALVKHVNVPTYAGVRGAVASAVTGTLYVSYGSDGFGGWMLAYDLSHDVVLWQQHYAFGIDSPSVTPNGKRIYMPDGELSGDGLWEVLDAGTGRFLGSINSNGLGPHNTVVPPNGAHVYMGLRFSNYLAEASTSSNAVLRQIGPVLQGVRPFVINGPETFAFITTTQYLGFQVGDINTGKIIYTVPVRGFNSFGGQSSALTHGISLSPNGKELYLIDSVNNYVHVFDVTPLPGGSPRQIADIQLQGTLYGVKPGCAYDCLREGWLHHSGDGRYVFVGDAGDVISTASRKSIAMLPAMTDSRVEIEIDFQGGSPVSAMNNRASGDVPGLVNPVATPTPASTRRSTPKPSATRTPRPSPTKTPFRTATRTPRRTATRTPVRTATRTPVRTAARTPARTATHTPVRTATRTPRRTATRTPVRTPTPRATAISKALWVTNTLAGTITEFKGATLTSPGVSAPNAALTNASANLPPDTAGVTFDGSNNKWSAVCGTKNGNHGSITRFSATAISQLGSNSAPAANVILSDDGTGKLVNCPWQTAFDKAGNLWAANSNEYQVIPGAGFVTEYQPRQFVTGHPTPHITLTSNNFISPTGVVFDSAGDLFVIDFGPGQFNPQNSGSGGVLVFKTSTIAALAAGTNKVVADAVLYDTSTYAPVSGALDSNGNLWVSDCGAAPSGEIYMFPRPALTSGATTAATVFQSASVATSGGTQFSIDCPGGIAFDTQGNMWYANFSSDFVDGLGSVGEFTKAQLSATGKSTPKPNIYLEVNSAHTNMSQPIGLIFGPSY